MFELQSLGIEYGTLAMFVLLLGFLLTGMPLAFVTLLIALIFYPWLVWSDGGATDYQQGVFICFILCFCLGADVRADGSDP